MLNVRNRPPEWRTAGRFQGGIHALLTLRLEDIGDVEDIYVENGGGRAAAGGLCL